MSSFHKMKQKRSSRFFSELMNTVSSRFLCESTVFCGAAPYSMARFTPAMLVLQLESWKGRSDDVE